MGLGKDENGGWGRRIVRKERESTPHPNPMASQARHELVSAQETCASRIVVPDRGGEGKPARTPSICVFWVAGYGSLANL
jgi:hypothetical protein